MFRSFVAFLRNLFRRDGLATIGKVFRYGFSPEAWKWLVRSVSYRRIVKASGLVDEDWYRREYPEVAERGADPVQDYLTPPHPLVRMPNPDFSAGEYAAINFDVRRSGLPWAVHYAGDGLREGRSFSAIDACERPFPPGSVELRRAFPAAAPVHRRTALFASFSDDGRINDMVLLYLRGLREVADNVVFVCNAPVLPDEVEKLDGLVRLAVFRHHGCYDFGSYKIGWNEANALGLLEPDLCDELVVCNDSCYGPVFPFRESFDEMARRNRESPPGERFDFWGMTSHELFERPHVQSYFYVFGKGVLEGSALGRFFSELKDHRERGQIVYYCETALSAALTDAGHRFESLVPFEFSRRHGAPPIKFPVTLFSRYRMPLLKAKTLRGESKESLTALIELVRKANPELAALLPPPPERTAFERRPRDGRFRGGKAKTAREGHASSLPEKAAAIVGAHANGAPVRILFLTPTAEPFPGEGLLDALRADSGFLATAAVVPDYRIPDGPDRFAAMRDARTALSARIGKEAMQRAETDADGEWTDLCASADVVCWQTAETASDFHYNPHWAVGRRFLPVLIFDRRTAGPYPLDKEFARQNYAYFWKIFFADREAFDLYAAHSIRKGENAVLAENDDAAAAFLKLFMRGRAPLHYDLVFDIRSVVETPGVRGR